jgi:hypothetical protein
VENDVGKDYPKGPYGGNDETFRDLVGRTITERLTDEGREFYELESTAKQGEKEHAVNPLANRFEFKTGEVLCDVKDTKIRKEDSREEVLQNLINQPNEIILFKELLKKQASEKEAEQPLRDAICDLRKKLKPFEIGIDGRRGFGYGR